MSSYADRGCTIIVHLHRDDVPNRGGSMPLMRVLGEPVRPEVTGVKEAAVACDVQHLFDCERVPVRMGGHAGNSNLFCQQTCGTRRCTVLISDDQNDN